MKLMPYYTVPIFALLAIGFEKHAAAQCCVEGACGNIIYVDKLATGNGEGTSWLNAMNDLTDAILATTTDDEIWVAAGTYVPRTGEVLIPTAIWLL